jgi:hypothetical protein
MSALTFENLFLDQALDRFSHPPNVKRPLKLPLPQAFFLLFFSFSSLFFRTRPTSSALGKLLLQQGCRVPSVNLNPKP